MVTPSGSTELSEAKAAQERVTLLPMAATLMGVVYRVLEAVGAEPSIVYRITAPGWMTLISIVALSPR